MEGHDPTNNGNPNGLLDIDGFCEYVPGMTRSLAAQLRYTGQGPRYVKVSAKLVVYYKQDVDDWLKSRKRTITAEL